MIYGFDEIDIPEAEPFKNDGLGRKGVVEFLGGLLQKVDSSFVMALDSPWGTGKTVLVKMLKAHLETKGERCIYFNAWEVDYSNDPLVALVASISTIDLETGGQLDSLKNMLRVLKN